jgi:hypothetical protein
MTQLSTSPLKPCVIKVTPAARERGMAQRRSEMASRSAMRESGWFFAGVTAIE